MYEFAFDVRRHRVVEDFVWDRHVRVCEAGAQDSAQFSGMRGNRGLSYVVSLHPVRVCKACRSSYFHVVAVVEGLEMRSVIV